jgi:hypothetical protein
MALVKPKGSIRFSGFGITFSLLFAYFILTGETYKDLNFLLLLPFVILGLVYSIMVCREFWTLKTKQNKKWKVIVYPLLSVTILIVLLALNDLGIFIWNQLYFEIPMTLYLATSGLFAWACEQRYKVKFYMSIEGTMIIQSSSL